MGTAAHPRICVRPKLVYRQRLSGIARRACLNGAICDSGNLPGGSVRRPRREAAARHPASERGVAWRSRDSNAVGTGGMLPRRPALEYRCATASRSPEIISTMCNIRAQRPELAESSGTCSKPKSGSGRIGSEFSGSLPKAISGVLNLESKSRPAATPNRHRDPRR